MKNFGIRTPVKEMEIEANVTAAILAEAERTGRKPSDLNRKDIKRVSDALMRDLAKDDVRAMAEEGIHQMVLQFLGDKIAEVVWDEGLGRSASKADILRIGRNLRFAGEIMECWQAWCDASPDFDFEKAKEFPSLTRFAPLFLAQPDDATLGEIATRKAARGDKLAQSFLAWREVA